MKPATASNSNTGIFSQAPQMVSMSWHPRNLPSPLSSFPAVGFSASLPSYHVPSTPTGGCCMLSTQAPLTLMLNPPHTFSSPEIRAELGAEAVQASTERLAGHAKHFTVLALLLEQVIRGCVFCWFFF